MRFIIGLFLSLASTIAIASPPTTYRQELAKTAFNFLYAHALCEDGQTPAQRGRVAPCEWVDPVAYDIDLAAKHLYDNNYPLRTIKIPENDWSRCGFTQCYNPFDELTHWVLIKEIYLLVTYGKEWKPDIGPPPAETK